MKFSHAQAALLLASVFTVAREMAKDEDRGRDLYDTGIMHARQKARKIAAWQAEADAGLLDSSVHPRLNYTKCINGRAEAIPGNPLYTFRCKNIDLYDFINHATLGSPDGWDRQGDGKLLTGSSSWGWTDPASDREFVASGMYEGVAFLEVLPEGRLLNLGFLPSPVATGNDSFWKETRGYKNYMLIGSEQEGHGIQIFDMTKLLTVPKANAPVVFDPIKDVTSRFMDLPIGASHNVVINEELDYAVAVGARPRNSTCGAGLIFIDLKDPAKPTSPGCNGQDGYVHDAQCLKYRGPDVRYKGRDVCYGYNEDTLTIYDVTDKANSRVISITSYEGATFTHQGWVLDPDWQEYLVMGDEEDEIEAAGPAADKYPVSYIWDISDLQRPKQTGLFKGTVPSVDHNQYIRDGTLYQSNYMAGFRVYDVSSIPRDPSGNTVCEIAYLDIYPEDDAERGGGTADLYGSWSSYAMFKSGFIYINTIERGGYLAKMTKREKCPSKHVCNDDTCSRAMRSKWIQGRLEESRAFCRDFTATVIANVGVVPTYAAEEAACGANVIGRVSSACSCLPAPTPRPVPTGRRMESF